MKICKQCGNLVSDSETICSKCGVATEIVYVNQASAAPAPQAAPAAPASQPQVAQSVPVQPVQQVQPTQVVQQAPVQQVQAQPVMQQQPMQQMPTQPMMQQPVQQVQPQVQAQPVIQQQPMVQQPMQPAIQIQAPVPQSSKLGSFFQKNSKAIIVALLVLLVVGGAGFGITQVAFKDREESKPITDNKDKFQLSDDDPSNKVEEPTEDPTENPGNNNQPALETYKKVSQNYMFTIPNAYVSSVQESAGGITLLNLDTGSNVWIGINVATLDAYRTNKSALKTSYESQGRTVLNMYDKVINNKDALILELISNEQKTLLAITQGPSTECFIITINNTTNKDEYDYTALSDMLGIIGTVQKVS